MLVMVYHLVDAYNVSYLHVWMIVKNSEKVKCSLSASLSHNSVVFLQSRTLISLLLFDFDGDFYEAVDFLRKAPAGKYDAIIVDSSDPIGTTLL